MCLHFIFIFLIFALIFLNFKFKLNSSLYHMSGYWLVSLILKFFHLFVTSFRMSCLSSDTLVYECLTSFMCILIVLPHQPKRYIYQADYQEISRLAVSLINIKLI